jgi:hypothetical protein
LYKKSLLLRAISLHPERKGPQNIESSVYAGKNMNTSAHQNQMGLHTFTEKENDVNCDCVVV